MRENVYLFKQDIRFSPHYRKVVSSLKNNRISLKFTKRALNIHCFPNSFIYLISYTMHKRCRKQAVSSGKIPKSFVIHRNQRLNVRVSNFSNSKILRYS